MSALYSLFKPTLNWCMLLFVSPFALSSTGTICFVFKWLSVVLLSAILFVLTRLLIVLQYN